MASLKASGVGVAPWWPYGSYYLPAFAVDGMSLMQAGFVIVRFGLFTQVSQPTPASIARCMDRTDLKLGACSVPFVKVFQRAVACFWHVGATT